MASFTLTSLTTANQTLFEGEIGFVAATGGNLGVVTMANSVLLNHGTLYGNQEAILVTATDAYIENHGSITGVGFWGVIDAYTGVDFLVRLELVNYGSITGRGPMDAAAHPGQ